MVRSSEPDIGFLPSGVRGGHSADLLPASRAIPTFGDRLLLLPVTRAPNLPALLADVSKYHPPRPIDMPRLSDRPPEPTTPPQANREEVTDTQVEVTARSLVQQQAERQKRRRTQSGGRGSSSRSSLWNTIAATLRTEDGKHMFVCAVCDFTGSVNSNLSTSNIILHYKTKHSALHVTLVTLNGSNATEPILRHRIREERERIARNSRRSSITRFFTCRTDNGNETADKTCVPHRVLQAVAVVMFSCAIKAPSSQIASPLLQGFIDVFGGRLQFSSRDVTDRTLFDTYAAICRILRSSVTHAKTGCITVDGWSAALGTSVLGMTWHYIDKHWNMHCVPVAMLNMGMASKTGQQLRSIIQEILEQNAIVGSEDVRVHTATSDNEAATALAVDLLTNYVGSVRCVVHTLALVVNDAFETGTVWKKYMDHVNKVTTYFNHRQKAAQLLAQKQVEEGITRDRLHRLKHDVPTRWHSRLAAMSVYLSRIQNISAVAEELGIDANDLPTLSDDQQDVLAEFITVLAEVRRVARQLEADRKVTMSRAPRLLSELHETLLIMGGDMLPRTSPRMLRTPEDCPLKTMRMCWRYMLCQRSPARRRQTGRGTKRGRSAFGRTTQKR